MSEISDLQCECGKAIKQCITSSCHVRKFKDLRREIWEGENGRRTRMDLGKALNTPNKARKAARFMILTRLLRQYGAVTENLITLGAH